MVFDVFLQLQHGERALRARTGSVHCERALVACTGSAPGVGAPLCGDYVGSLYVTEAMSICSAELIAPGGDFL